MDKNLESLRLSYGEHNIKVKTKAALRKDSLASNAVTYNSQPRVELEGKVITLYNIPSNCSGAKIYDGEALLDTVSIGGAVLTTNSYNIDMNGYELEDGNHAISLKVICGSVETQTSSVTLVIQSSSASGAFAENSWADIVEAANSGNIPATWNIGDEKDIELSTGETITMQIIGFDHDDLADGSGKAKMTLMMKNCLATGYNMNSTGTTTGGWAGSAMYGRMATYLGYLPPELQAGIKEVTKKTASIGGNANAPIVESTDKLFLLSHVEVMGSTNRDYNGEQRSVVGEGSQYEYFKMAQIPTGQTAYLDTGCFYNTGSSSYTNRFGENKPISAKYLYNYNNAKGLGNNATSAYSWWLRSPSTYTSSYFCFVNVSGYASYYYAYSTSGLSFGFCL